MKIYDEFVIGGDTFSVVTDSLCEKSSNIPEEDAADEIVYIRNEKYGCALSKLDFFCMVSWMYLAKRNVERIIALGKNDDLVECARVKVGESLLVVDYQEGEVRITYFWQMVLSSAEFFAYVEHLMHCMDDMVGLDNFKCEYYDAIFLANDAYKFVYALERIEYDEVCVGEMLVYDESEDGKGQLIPVKEGRVYAALEEDDVWRVSRWEQINYFGYDNVTRCMDMYQKIAEKGYLPDKYGAYIVLFADTNWIRDGSHRAACILKKFGDIKVKVARWYSTIKLTQAERFLFRDIRQSRCGGSCQKNNFLQKVLIYGAGENFKCYYPWISNRYEIVGVVDKDAAKIGTDIKGFRVENLNRVRDGGYDRVLITPNAYRKIKVKLITLGVESNHIITLHEISSASVGKDFVSICFYLQGRFNISDRLINLNYVLAFYDKICNPQCFLDIAVDSKLELTRELCEARNMSSRIRDVRLGLGNDKNKYDLIVSIDPRYPEVLQIKEDRLIRMLPEAIDYMMTCKKFSVWNKRYYKSHNPAYLSANETSGYLELLFHRKRVQQPDIYDFISLSGSHFDTNVSAEPLEKYGVQSKEFITVHFGVFHNRFYRAHMKVWPEQEVSLLVKLIREKYPNLKIILIRNSSYCYLDSKVDAVLDDHVDLDVLKALMKHSLLHVDIDDFLVHLRHFLGGGKSVVVFGPTSDEFYGYEENINVRGSSCGIACEGVSRNWEWQCLKSSGKTRCMCEVGAEQVFDLIESNGGIAG